MQPQRSCPGAKWVAADETTAGTGIRAAAELRRLASRQPLMRSDAGLQFGRLAPCLAPQRQKGSGNSYDDLRSERDLNARPTA